jgi:hypothetical protein
MKGYIQWVGGALLFALITISYSTCNKYKHQYKEQSSLIGAMQDSIKLFKNKDGENSAQISLLEGDKENLLSILGKSNTRLSKLIKQGASSGTLVTQITQIDTVVLVKRDTIDGSCDFENTISNGWYTLNEKRKDDSLQVQLEIRDSISVSFQKVKQGFLKPKKSVVIVSNANPYVNTTGLRSFQIPEKKSRLRFWLNFGLGAGAGYLLFK